MSYADLLMSNAVSLRNTVSMAELEALLSSLSLNAVSMEELEAELKTLQLRSFCVEALLKDAVEKLQWQYPSWRHRVTCMTPRRWKVRLFGLTFIVSLSKGLTMMYIGVNGARLGTVRWLGKVRCEGSLSGLWSSMEDVFVKGYKHA